MIKKGNKKGDHLHYIEEVLADFAEILKKLSGATLLPNQLKPFHMAFSKHHLYDPTDQLIGNYAHCISHAARILIIKQLLTLGPTVVQVIARDHPIHRESLAGHLKILRDANIIVGEERFPYTFYSIQMENLKKACDYLTDLLNILNSLLVTNTQIVNRKS